MASRSDRIEKEAPKILYLFIFQFDQIESIRSGGVIQLARHVPTGPSSPRQSIAVWALSTIPNEAINREPQRAATGATAAPTDTDHSTACPAVAPQKKSWRSQAQFSHQLDRPGATRNKRSTQTQEKLKTSIAASPSLSRAWGLRASTAHSRKAESDSFPACAAKKKQTLSAASTRRCTPSV